MEIIRELFRQNFSSHVALQNLYYFTQRTRLYGFLIMARLNELLWRAKLISIE